MRHCAAASLRARRYVGVLVHFLCVQVRKHAIAEILEDQRLSTVANDDPVALANLHFGHAVLRGNLVSV